METQTMIELCHFGKRTILPHPECIPVPLPNLFNHWAYAVGPTEFSHAGGIAEHWDFWSVFQAGFCLGVRWEGAELCDYIARESLLSPLQVQPTLSQERREVSALQHVCWQHPQKKIVWPSQVPVTPPG